MAHITRRIGLSLGADICWPICYEALLKQLDLRLAMDGNTISIESERVHIEPFDLRQACSYDVVIDRLTHWYHTSREWIKKAVLVNDLYVFNNPWSLQSMEKQTTYAAMMRLGFPVPDTWMIPPKEYEESADLQPTLSRYARLFDLGAIGDRIAYPLYMKPYDGGAWVGVTAIHNRQELLAAYELSGTRVMNLQKGVLPNDAFVRCIGLGPQFRLVNYDPGAPLHDRYRMEQNFLPPGQAQQLADMTLVINAFFWLGLQLLRSAAPGRYLASHRFRQCLPGFTGDLAALPFSLVDQGQPALVDLLRGYPAAHENQSRLA